MDEKNASKATKARNTMGMGQQTLHSVLNLFTAPSCSLCDRPTSTILCQDCQTQIQTCQHPNPQQFWRPPLPVFAWGHYSGSLKRGIAALKYHNQPRIAWLFGQWLGIAWLASSMATSFTQQKKRSLLVIPVPASAAKKNRRGYDQAELIAKAFCHYTKLPLDLHRVIRAEDTMPMHGLSLAERQQNVQGTFQLHPRLKSKSFNPNIFNPGTRTSGARNPPSILLLDDIHTSGATINAIAHLLRHHQMSVYGAVTLAKAGLVQDSLPKDAHED